MFWILLYIWNVRRVIILFLQIFYERVILGILLYFKFHQIANLILLLSSSCHLTIRASNEAPFSFRCMTFQPLKDGCVANMISLLWPNIHYGQRTSGRTHHTSLHTYNTSQHSQLTSSCWYTWNEIHQRWQHFLYSVHHKDTITMSMGSYFPLPILEFEFRQFSHRTHKLWHVFYVW